MLSWRHEQNFLCVCGVPIPIGPKMEISLYPYWLATFTCFSFLLIATKLNINYKLFLKRSSINFGYEFSVH